VIRQIHYNCEIVGVDNCSADNAAEILASINDPRSKAVQLSRTSWVPSWQSLSADCGCNERAAAAWVETNSLTRSNDFKCVEIHVVSPQVYFQHATLMSECLLV
jgi:hypothetical protein